MKYLIIGKNGQLGKEFCKTFDKLLIDYKALNHKELDITNFWEVYNCIKTYKPDYIINCSAYNHVDSAETEIKQAYRVNCLGVFNLRLVSELFNSFLIHFSTDYVFNGTHNFPYSETDNPNPINKYGKSKLLGEETMRSYSNSLIFRTSWVYGDGNQNFIYKFLSWCKQNKIILINGDEISIPTSTRLIVEMTLEAIKYQLKGLYHLTCDSFCSRWEYAKVIKDILNLDNELILSDSNNFNLKAKRPVFSALNNRKLAYDLGKRSMSLWEDELYRYLKENI